MPPVNDRVGRALAPVLAATARSTGLDAADALELHREILGGFASVCGIGVRVTAAAADPSSSWLQFDASLGVHCDGADVRVILTQAELESADAFGPVVLLAYLYLPASCRSAGAGTALLQALGVVWARLGAKEIHASATEDGSCAFARWGFTLRRRGPIAGRLRVKNELAARAHPLTGACPVPRELEHQLQSLLSAAPAHSPLVDMRAILDLTTADGDRYGRRLLDGFIWPAWRRLDTRWATGEGLDSWMR